MVYLTAKYAEYLKISHPDFSSIEFALPYDLKPKCGYEMTLVNKSPNIDKNNYLIIKVDQQNAKIFIDDELMGTGYASKVVSIGEEHRYKVSCDDYFPKEGLVYFDKREDKEISVVLEPNFGYITIKSDPSGADIYVDEVKVGVTPYLMKKITPGDHVVELRKAGYESYADMVLIKVDEVNKQFENVTLTAIRIPMGSLDLTSEPSGAVITINGRQYGQTPKVLTDFEVGTYTVYFTKEGYENLVQTVTVKDGKKETLAVTMTKRNAQLLVPTINETNIPNNNNKVGAVTGNQFISVKGVSFEMVAVKGGTFTMGGTSEQGGDCYSDEKPTHSVTLSDYYIGKFEVTQELWQAVMGNNPSYFKGNNLPVEKLSWNDVQEFITKLNQKTGANFRLPTEAEWEYAARGGNKSRGYKYSGSNNIGDVAWYTNNSGSKTHQVGTKAPNELGIYDMSGNVYEWCQDLYGSYSSSSQNNPTGLSSGSSRVLRGGSCYNDASCCRVSYRVRLNPDLGNSRQGFRLVLVP